VETRAVVEHDAATGFAKDMPSYRMGIRDSLDNSAAFQVIFIRHPTRLPMVGIPIPLRATGFIPVDLLISRPTGINPMAR
jgi:hypothetical protein